MQVIYCIIGFCHACFWMKLKDQNLFATELRLDMDWLSDSATQLTKTQKYF